VIIKKREIVNKAKLFLTAVATNLLLAHGTQAVPLVTTNDATITAFQAGASVYDLEALSAVGVDALDATLDGLIPLAGTTIYKIGGGHFHSGGASFNDLGGNPGAPSVVGELDPAIRTSNVRSGSHVLLPTHSSDNGDPLAATVCADGACFFEIEFVNPIAKFGGWIGGGNATVFVKDRIKLADGTDDTTQLEFFNVTAGEFFGVTSALTNIDSITIFANGSPTFLLDDITIGGAGNGGGTVPLPSSLALLLAGVPFLRRFCA
jgi:hypothetical protein